MQTTQLAYVTSSSAAAAGLAENYTGACCRTEPAWSPATDDAVDGFRS
jgi:hypothetical protein